MRQTKRGRNAPSEGIHSNNSEALRKSEQLYHRMVDEVLDYAIILLDKEGIVQNWNKGAEKIKLYKEEEIVGKSFSLFYLQEDQQSGLPKKLIRDAEQEGRAIHEGWRVRKDKTQFWGSVTITALHDDIGQVIGFVKVTRDLTERKLAEDQQLQVAEELKQRNEELRRSEERYHQMVVEVQDYAIILLDLNGDIKNWNKGAEFIKGYGPEIIGSNFRVFYSEEDRKNQLPENLLEQARTKGKANHEGWRIRKDGSKFWGSIVITALHGKEGNLIGFSKVTRDLTEKKLAEDRLVEYTTELELRNRELEQFAYVASHDLQEPLRKIRTFSEIIQHNISDPLVAGNYLTKVNSAAKRMSDLIQSVLNYSRLTTSGIEMTDVDLNDVLQNVVLDFELVIEEKAARIVRPDQLPVVKGHSLQLTQLFANLISNSLKFSAKDPLITISSRIINKAEISGKPSFLRDITYYEISFADNGIGFDQQYSELIFTMFQRLHGGQEYSGTGIGLALCKKIVEIHHGYIAARSEPGRGSSFFVYLPAS